MFRKVVILGTPKDTSLLARSRHPCQLVDISAMIDAEFNGFMWYGAMAKAMKYIYKYRKDIISLIEQMLPELQKIEDSGRINYVFTTIKYFFEIG